MKYLSHRRPLQNLREVPPEGKPKDETVAYYIRRDEGDQECEVEVRR